MSQQITKIISREIIDSRGYPTVEVDLFLSNGIRSRASVPSGASVGKFEAIELRDNDEKYYCGKGITKSLNIITNEIAPAILGLNVFDQEIVDYTLNQIDGTHNKSRIGANSTLAVSLAAAKAAAKSLNIPLYKYLGGSDAKLLPIPLLNMINGGLHADNSLDFQEFIVIPLNSENFRCAIRKSVEVFHKLKEILKEKNYSANVGDEGGFAPNIKTNEEAIEIIIEAIEKAGYKIFQDFALGLDVAASTFYKNGLYNFSNLSLTSEELVKYYDNLLRLYPIITIEDPMSEDDIDGWKLMTNKLAQIQLVGDDLFVTNCELIKNGIDNNIANAVLIKANQIGTLTETIRAIKLAQSAGYKVIVSHRSGETEDVTISHIAVAFNCGQIKSGSVSRSERLAKYNELMRIEQELDHLSQYKNDIN